MKTFIIVLLITSALAAQVSDRTAAATALGAAPQSARPRLSFVRMWRNKKSKYAGAPRDARFGRTVAELNCAFKTYFRTCRFVSGFRGRYACYNRAQRTCKCTIGAYLNNCRKTRGYRARLNCYNRGLRNCNKKY